jgi:hypothetical protein
MNRKYEEEAYTALPPQADDDGLARKGERVILFQLRSGGNQHIATLRVAPKGVVSAGWVIGIIQN